MNKIIEKIEQYKEKNLDKALSNAKTNYEEAKASFNDTGHYRYYNKMEKLRKEIEEMEAYSKNEVPKSLSTYEYREYFQMKQDMKNIKSKLEYLVKDLGLPITSDLAGIKRILEKY